MSKFSDQVAQGMSEILENKSFYKPFNKTTVKTASTENVFNITELELRYPDAYNALLDSDKEKFKYYTFFLNSVGKICAKEPGGTDEYLFTQSPNHTPTWIKTAESDGNAFELYAAKKKKEDDDKDDKKDKKSDKKEKSDKDEKDDKKEKSDKKSKKDDKDDEEEDEKDDKKSKKKKSKKDEDENDARGLIFAAKKSKEDKKDGEEKTEKSIDKDDKPKGKKKQFPFWLKKKKAGENCKEDCDCDECMEANDGMFASAIRHIVESFTKTSTALENMGLDKSSIATMAILDHIIEEAAYVKMAKTTPLEEKLTKLKEKFKKMHEKDEAYDADVAEELDKKITEIEEQIKEEKKNKDFNDVRGTDLLLGLDDPEAREGFLDHNLDDPHSSAALEEILSKNPSLVDEIAPRLKSQFSDQAIEDQLKNRIKSRLPSIIDTPKENSDFSEIMKAYKQEIPDDAIVPSELKETLIPGTDPLKTKIDMLNAKDEIDEDEIIAKMVKELQKNTADYDDNGEVDCTHLAEEMADKLGLLEGDDDKVPDYVFECATEAAEKYENMHEKEEDDYNDSNDHKSKHSKLPSHEHGKPVIYLTDKDKVLCADCATDVKNDGGKVKGHLNEEGPDHHCENCGEKLESEYGDTDSNDITAAFNLVNKWVKSAEDNFEDDDSDTKVTQDDLKSILDVIGGYSQKEINDRETAMVPSELDSFANKYLNLVK